MVISWWNKKKSTLKDECFYLKWQKVPSSAHCRRNVMVFFTWKEVGINYTSLPFRNLHWGAIQQHLSEECFGVFSFAGPYMYFSQNHKYFLKAIFNYLHFVSTKNLLGFWLFNCSLQILGFADEVFLKLFLGIRWW